MGVSQSGDSLTSFGSPSSNLRQQHSSTSTYGTLQSVGIEEFFRTTGLNERFANIFHRQGVKSVAALCRLSQLDLAAMGFRLEEQQRIFEAIQRWQQATLPRRNYQPATASSSLLQTPSYHLNQKQTHSNDGFFV